MRIDARAPAVPYLLRCMSDRIRLAALLGLALVALATLGVIVYNVVANDWRLVGNPLDLSFLFGDDEPELDVDGRSVVHSRRFGPDSIGVIRIETRTLRVRVTSTQTSQIEARFALDGDATDSSIFAWSAEAASGELRLGAAPNGAPGNASGSLEITIPSTSRIAIIIVAHAGEISVTNVSAGIDATALGGSIELTGVNGRVAARSDGDIVIDACRLDSAVLIAAGAVSLSLTEGAVHAEASEIAAARHFGSLDATARGAIRAEILSRDAPVRLVSHEGNVALRVLDGARFAYDVDAPSGSIVANVPFDSLTEENATEHRVRATMNGGGVPAVIRAARGNVEILLFEAAETSERRLHVEPTTRRAALALGAVRSLSGGARRAVEGP